MHLLSFVAVSSLASAVLAACPQYVTIPGFSGSNGCIPGGYSQAQDQGQLTRSELIARCEQACASNSNCEAWVAQIQTSPNGLSTGQCFYYPAAAVPKTPTQCADHPTDLIAERKNRCAMALSAISPASASADCSSRLGTTITKTVTPSTTATSLTVTTSTSRSVYTGVSTLTTSTTTLTTSVSTIQSTQTIVASTASTTTTTTTLQGVTTTTTSITTSGTLTITSTSTVTYTTLIRDPGAAIVNKRADTPQTVPAYASSACQSFAAYSSACGCFGVTPYSTTVTVTASTAIVSTVVSRTSVVTLVSTPSTTKTVVVSSTVPTTTTTVTSTTSSSTSISTIVSSLQSTFTVGTTSTTTTTTTTQVASQTPGSQRFRILLKSSNLAINNSPLYFKQGTDTRTGTLVNSPVTTDSTVCEINAYFRLVCSQYLIGYLSTSDPVYGFSYSGYEAYQPTLSQCSVSAPPESLITCAPYGGASAFYLSSLQGTLTYDDPSAVPSTYYPVQLVAVFI